MECEEDTYHDYQAKLLDVALEEILAGPLGESEYTLATDNMGLD